ncbi:hypothetical protein CR513_05511, partial [Mucuna pruriens]
MAQMSSHNEEILNFKTAKKAWTSLRKSSNIVKDKKDKCEIFSNINYKARECFSNVGLATSLVMWRKFEKTKQINNHNKPKFLNKNKIRNIYLLSHAIQQARIKRCDLQTMSAQSYFSKVTISNGRQSGCFETPLDTKYINQSILNVEWKKIVHVFSSVVDGSSLWHKTLSHFNYSTLKQMSLNSLVQNLPSNKDDVDVCDVCQFRKHIILSFPIVVSCRAIEKSQLIPISVCDLMSTISLNENYFIDLGVFSKAKIMCSLQFRSSSLWLKMSLC